METKKCKYNTGGLCQKKSGATFSLVYCDESCIQTVIKKIDKKRLKILNEVCDWIGAFGGLYIDYDEQGAEVNIAKMIRDLRKYIIFKTH